MCGIAGVIGKSKHAGISYQLVTRLLERSESRGSDATGFWGAVPGDGGAVIYHKEPTKSTEFVHREQWKNVKTVAPNLLIMHARQSSQGMGDANVNRNNHPFVSADKSLGLVHNGRISEYMTLKRRYEVKSECDSEVLLRIFETGRAADGDAGKELPDTPDDVTRGVLGIKDIFAYVNEGHMAVALGERLDGGRRDLWLFHNKERPLWIADCRDALGQMFFFSTPEIWRDAVRDCNRASAVIGGRKHRIVKVPDDEIWYFTVDDKNQTVTNDGYMRFTVNGEDSYTPWDHEGSRYPIPQATKTLTVISDLGENDELSGVVPLAVNRHKKRKNGSANWYDQGQGPTVPKVEWRGGTTRYADQAGLAGGSGSGSVGNNRHPDEDAEEDNDDDMRYFSGRAPLRRDDRLVPVDEYVAKAIERRLSVGYNNDRFDLDALEKTVRQIRKQAEDIETTINNMVKENSMTTTDFQTHLEALEMVSTDLRGTMHMIDSV